MRSAIRLTRGKESHFFVAPTLTDIVEYLDFASIRDLARDPQFDGLFEEQIMVDLKTMTCRGSEWRRVA